jgi:hypothetical protein
MGSLEAEMLAFIRAGLDHHNETCPMPAQAILLNPSNHELFGWDELWGIPVLPDEKVAPKRFRIQCEGSAAGIEEAVEQFVAAPVEERRVVPVGPREDEPAA